MSLAKIVVTGTVTKNPEKRFTQNNLAVTSFVMDINREDETLVRVIAVGALADRTADTVKTGDVVIVDGRLQTENVKTTSGKDKKNVSITAAAVEKISGAQSNQSQAQPAQKPEAIVQFATEEIAEDLIDEDEIPF